MSFDSLDRVFYGNTLGQWGVALGVAVVALVLLRLLVGAAARRLERIAGRTRTGLDDLVVALLGQTKFLFLLAVVLYVAIQLLTLPNRAAGLVRSIAVIALLVQGGIWATTAVLFWLERYREEKLSRDAAAVTTVSALGFGGKLVIWTIVLLLTLDNLGFDITTLVTGLGVGGIAVALAVQNILGDLFASLSIVLDKPFVIGDFLILDDFMGRVQKIGLKTTRLRSLSGEELIFSNNDLLNSRIRNYGRLFERRVLFTIGVTYQTPRDKLEKLPTILREAVEHQDKTRFDRSHFKSYGPYSIDFETVYYVLAPEYGTYMDIQQAINLEIHRRFEEEGIEFAYPTQTLFVVKENQ